MYRIAIIGSGQLGSRHLQALALINIPISIDVVDPSPQSLDIAKVRFEEVIGKGLVEQVAFYSSLSNLRHPVDLGIIATNADVRKKIIQDLIQKTPVRYLILEKVVFQSPSDFKEILALLKKHQILAWVNCPRRMNPFYQKIRTYFQEGEPIHFHFQGGNWGLGSNTIHILDLFAYLTGENNVVLEASGLDDEVFEGKRKKFVEFSGTLKGTIKNGSTLCLTSDKRSSAPSVYDLLGGTSRYVIMESLGKAFFAHQANHWQWEEERFEMPYQSQMTHLVVESILKSEKCSLTPIDESYELHKPLLECFSRHLEKIQGEYCHICPIT